MRKKISKKQKEISLPIKSIIGLSVSCLVGAVITIFFSFLFSYILSKSPEITKLSSVYFIVSILIGGLVCGFISTKLLSFKGLISGLLSSVPLIIIIFTIMLFFSNGRLNNFSVIVLFVVLISTTIGGIVSANTKRRK